MKGEKETGTDGRRILDVFGSKRGAMLKTRPYRVTLSNKNVSFFSPAHEIRPSWAAAALPIPAPLWMFPIGSDFLM